MFYLKMVDYPMSFISPSGVAKLELELSFVNGGHEGVIKILRHLTSKDKIRTTQIIRC